MQAEFTVAKNDTSTDNKPVATLAIQQSVRAVVCRWSTYRWFPPLRIGAEGKVYFTATNLNNKFHRAIKVEATSAVLLAIFSDEQHFAHHKRLPHGVMLSYKGTANKIAWGRSMLNIACRCLFTGVRNLMGKSRQGAIRHARRVRLAKLSPSALIRLTTYSICLANTRQWSIRVYFVIK